MSNNTYVRKGAYWNKDGPARKVTDQCCNKKLCFAATDQAFLKRLLDSLSLLDDCFFVKYSAEPRDGMFLGRCFLTSEDRVGEIWGKYKSRPKVFCNVQDDDFTERHRDKVLSWTSRDHDALD